MSVSLKKGQKVNLTKSDGRVLTKLRVGLGWDAVEQPKGFFAKIFNSKTDFDCDASVFMCQDGRFVDKDDLVYFGHLEHDSHAVKHMGDNLTGEGEGDDEQIFVDLEKLPSRYDRIIFVVNIYKAAERKQHFGMIKNAYIRIVDSETEEELCNYNLTDDYSDMLSIIAGEVYRKNDVWKFNAIGSGTKDINLTELSKRFR